MSLRSMLGGEHVQRRDLSGRHALPRDADLPRQPYGGGSRGNRREPSRLPKLTPAQYRILGVIAAAGGIPISKSDIAEAAGCVVRTADRALQRLRAEGLVESVGNFAEAGGQMANSYRIRAQVGESTRARIRLSP